MICQHGQPTCQAALNGEFGNTRDARMHADGAKSRFPKRAVWALRRRNSLRMAIQSWGGARNCCRFRDCGPHSAQTEQAGETALLICLSQPSQFHFAARPNVGSVYSRSHDAVIRTYDEAGNVVEHMSTRGISKSGESALGTATTKLHYFFERGGVGLGNFGVRVPFRSRAPLMQSCRPYRAGSSHF
jgi:hypothetical protein